MTEVLLALPSHLRKRLESALEAGTLGPPYRPIAVRAALGGVPESEAVAGALARVLRAGGIVRAEPARLERAQEVLVQPPRLLHQAAQRPLRVRAAGVDEEAVAAVLGVDALAERAGRIAAVHGERLDQQVRQSVQQDVRAARKRPRVLPLQRPSGVAPLERVEAAPHRGPLPPSVDGVAAKPQEQPLAPVLHRREPARLQRDGGALDVRLVLAVDVRRHRLEPREPGQGQHLAQPVELDDRLDARAPVGPAPHGVRQPARVEVLVDGHVVAEALGGGEDRLELDLLHGPLGPRGAALQVIDRREDLVVGERRERRDHRRLPLHEREARRVVDDRQVVPELPHRRLHRRPPLRQRQHADHLREPGVGRGAHQQPARQVAVLVGATPEPRPRAPARPQRVRLHHARVRETAYRPALASHEEVRKVAAGALLVEPQRPGRRAVAAGTMHEPAPVDVVDVAPRTGADEPGGHDPAALETAPVVERPPGHQPPGPDVSLALVRLLDDEPLGKAPHADAHRRRAGIGRYRRRGHHARRADAGDRLQLPREPRLVDLLQLVQRRPLVEPRDDRLSVRLLPHDAPVCPGARRSRRYRFTSGSTSRSERLARNFR